MSIDGDRVPLVSQQGIFKPRVLPDLPLSIRTSARGPYDDHFGPGGETLLYAYRGTDPQHPDNVRLRKAMAIRCLSFTFTASCLEGIWRCGPSLSWVMIRARSCSRWSRTSRSSGGQGVVV